jgi:hypothetical protein
MNRLVLAASDTNAETPFKSVEIKGSEKMAQFLATIELSSKRRFHHSPIKNEYSIQCFSNEQHLLDFTLPGYKPTFFSWELPDSSKDRGVLKRSSLNSLLAWLATNGCDILQREQAADNAAKQRRLQAELNCVACFPRCLLSPGSRRPLQPSSVRHRSPPVGSSTRAQTLRRNQQSG